jgi:outer membrane protein TolC
LRRAEQDLLATKARIAIEVEREWHNLEAAKSMAASQLAQLQALSLSLHAIKRGQTAGIATRADEEQLRLQMLAAERELAFTHTKALNAWARLMACVGKLSASALEQLQETALIH